jgi:hypothetical protein
MKKIIPLLIPFLPLILLAASAPAPPPRERLKPLPVPHRDYTPLSSRPLHPYTYEAGGAPVSGYWTNGTTWISDPNRQTRCWTHITGYIQCCDDPDCHICYDTVYRQDEEREEQPIRRGGR